MAKVELNERATSPGFWLMITALIFGVYAAVQIVDGPGDKRAPMPTPIPTVVTGTVAPSPLCDSKVPTGQCWETEDEVGPPWYWRESPRVWPTATGVR